MTLPKGNRPSTEWKKFYNNLIFDIQNTQRALTTQQ